MGTTTNREQLLQLSRGTQWTSTQTHSIYDIVMNVETG